MITTAESQIIANTATPAIECFDPFVIAPPTIPIPIARGNASHLQGSVGVYEPGQERRALELIRIVGDFPRALQQREIKVEFQPKIDCTSLELAGAEALVRWDHPELGRLSPGEFIEAIEQAGGISQLTRWVLEETAATIARWRETFWS